MVVSVPNSRKLAETLRVLKDRVTYVWRAAFHLGQPLDQVNSGAGRVQRQKDDDRDILVGAGQSGDQMNQQAFRVGPHVVQLADQQDQAVKSGFEIVSQRAVLALRPAQPRNRIARLQSGC